MKSVTLFPHPSRLLSQANSSGKLNSGDKVLLLGFGVGYSWGGCVVHWS